MGNFLLTESNDNSSFGNKSFIDKKESYQAENGIDLVWDPLEDSELCWRDVKNNKWDSGLIESRSTKIIDFIKENF